MSITQWEGTLTTKDENGNLLELFPAIKTDESLSISGKAADAKIIGDILKDKTLSVKPIEVSQDRYDILPDTKNSDGKLYAIYDGDTPKFMLNGRSYGGAAANASSTNCTGADGNASDVQTELDKLYDISGGMDSDELNKVLEGYVKTTDLTSASVKHASTADSATLATKATSDGAGNNIADTYVTKTEVTNASVKHASTASAATNDANGNNISATYVTKEESRAVLNGYVNPTVVALVSDNSAYTDNSGNYILAESTTGLELLADAETYTRTTVEGNFYRMAGADSVNPFKSGSISAKQLIQNGVVLGPKNAPNRVMLFYGLASMVNISDFVDLQFDDTSDVTDTSYMFYDCQSLQTVPEFDTSKVTDMSYMFYDCQSLQTVPEFDTSKVTDMSYMFYKCDRLTSVPLYDTSNVTNMSSMFRNCYVLTSVPLFDTSKVTDMTLMFGNCLRLTIAPEFDTSNVTGMGYMFSCTNITSVPLYDTSKVTNMAYMLDTCTRLTTVPEFDTSGVTRTNSMFYNCIALETVPELDMTSVTYNSYMFYYCQKLTNCKLRNIKISLQVGSGTSYGHLLTLESLLFMIGELVNVDASMTFTIGTANLAKLTDVYVKLVTITDEMRLKDSLIDAKKPFEVCDSTDTGAMTIDDYVHGKNWTLK